MTDQILVLGARGLAKEILFSFPEYENKFVFFDDINENDRILYNKFKILKSTESVNELFSKKFQFVIGVGSSRNREFLYNKFIQLGGKPLIFISKGARIGKYDTFIGDGTVIMDGAIVSNSVKIGKGNLINKCTIISHDVRIGDYCNISPSVRIMGRVSIGDNVDIGVNALVIPDIVIGTYVVVGAGTVITMNIPDNSVVVGNPCRITRKKNN